MRSAPALRHHAFIHTSDEEYVERTVAFLMDGLAAGDRCIAANTRDGLAAVREALGADAPRVTFLDIGSLYTRPARTIAAYFGAFRRETAGGDAVRAVASASQYGPTTERLGRVHDLRGDHERRVRPPSGVGRVCLRREPEPGSAARGGLEDPSGGPQRALAGQRSLRGPAAARPPAHARAGGVAATTHVRARRRPRRLSRAARPRAGGGAGERVQGARDARRRHGDRGQRGPPRRRHRGGARRPRRRTLRLRGRRPGSRLRRSHGRLSRSPGQGPPAACGSPAS